MKKILSKMNKYLFSLVRWFKDFQWIIIALLWLMGLFIGYIGFSQYVVSSDQSYSWLTRVYLTFQLVTFESGALPGYINPYLNVARFLLPILVAYTSLKALMLVFREQFQFLRLFTLRDHVVICGLSNKGYHLAQAFTAQGQHVVLIELDEDNPYVDICRDEGLVVLMGDATDIGILEKAGVAKAKHVIAVTEDDGLNIEVAMAARSVFSQKNSRKCLQCIVHIINPQLCELMKTFEFSTSNTANFQLSLFNVYEKGARVMLSDSGIGLGKKSSDQPPHILVVGLGKFGENIVINAAYEWHQSNFSGNNKLRFSVVDPDAEWKIEALVNRYPLLLDTCLFNPIPILVQHPQFQQANFVDSVGGSTGLDVIFICLDNDSLGIYSALTLHNQIIKNQIPIYIRMLEDVGLAKIFDQIRLEERYRNLIPFGLMDRTCTPEQVTGGVIEQLAFAIHNNYIRQQKALGMDEEANPSIAPWSLLPENLKESNRQQAFHIREKLRIIKCDISPKIYWKPKEFLFSNEEVDLLARLEHQRWMKEKIDQGWVYAPGEKDPMKKPPTNPNLLEWDMLPEVEKEKNKEIIRVLPDSLAKIGFQIERRELSS
jgi:hypothetical protein